MRSARAKWLYALLCAPLILGLFFSFWYTAVSPTGSYDFDPTDESSFVMVSTEKFRAVLPSGVEYIVFSDCLSPYAGEVNDLSENGLGGVAGWYENGKYFISTRTKGKKVVLNAQSKELFASLSSLRSVDLSMADTSRVTDFGRFFYGCTSLEEADISSFDMGNAVSLRSMFMNCYKLKRVDLGTAKGAGILDTGFMFAGTGELASVDMRGWDLSSVICSTAMFQSTGASEILLPDSLSSMGAFFFNHADAYAGEEFTLPSSICELGLAHLFYNFGTSSFVAFCVPEGSSAAKVTDGVLYSKDGSTLLAVPKGKIFRDGVFEIDEGVTFLGELSFSRNTSIKRVVLPNSYRLTVYTETDHADFADIGGSGNKSTGNSLNLATYIFSGVEEFSVKEDNPVYRTLDGALYTKGEDGAYAALIAVPVGYTGALYIPEGVTSWEKEALWEQDGVRFSAITEISIPKTLTDIAQTQIEKINSLDVRLTVDAENPVYTVDHNGQLVLK